ncbi:hypothetical protein SO694_00131053 [Aureococcus anophagefferens]|uniref:Uncharacterized protein n=1 Tax=Aureococcus anophagefferens TaxID=44056 RepID=A0ABR1GFJ5_AURAN
MAKLLALVAGARAAHHHLNPTMPYTITNEAPGHEGESREFSGAAYFDVDSPVLTMRYSEVAWRTLPASFVHGNGQEHRQMFHGAPPATPQRGSGARRRSSSAPVQISTNDGDGDPGQGALPAIKRPGGATPAPPSYAYSPLLEVSRVLGSAPRPCVALINATAGTIDGHAFDGDRDRAEPLSDLNATKNPTCEAATYVGGLSCCADGAFLLDADQEPPAFEDRVFFRFRFYYDDWDDDKYADIEHVEWAANGCDSGCSGGGCANACGHIEFDVVRGVGSDEGDDVQIFQSTFPAGEMLASSCKPTDCQCMGADTVGESGFALVMAASHCHAPNCIRQVLKNLDSGEILCDGKTRVGSSEKVFDEAGYLFTPPCLWGAAADGLLAPPVLKKDTTLQMLTYFNSTYAHPGQMGIWQMKATALSA